MKKNVILLLVVTAAIFVGCASMAQEQGSLDPQAKETPSTVQKPVMLDHQASATRGDKLPDWMNLMIDGTNSGFDKLYPDQVVFTINERGTDLDVLKYWSNTFDANALIAGQLQTFYNDKSAAITKADKSSLEKAGETLAATSRKATFSGLRKEGEYWIQWKLTDGKIVYNYYVLYTMTKEDLKSNLARIEKNMPQEAKPIITPVFDAINEKGFFN